MALTLSEVESYFNDKPAAGDLVLTSVARNFQTAVAAQMRVVCCFAFDFY